MARGGKLRVGLFGGPWDTGRAAKDGAVHGFEDVFSAFQESSHGNGYQLRHESLRLFTDYRKLVSFLAGSDVVYANCGPWAALLHLARQREGLETRIIREVRTVGWIGYIWQEAVARQLSAPGDLVTFPSRYARDTWDATGGDKSTSRVYYPLLRHQQGTRPAIGSTASVGFFSALSADKGFDCLPAIMERMQACGHRVRRLVLAGERADPALFDRVRAQVERLGIEWSYRGGLPNARVRELMRHCDCVFFPSVSSIESLGRIMVEAYEQGVPVITAEFGAALDLVRPEYRIPVSFPSSISGSSERAFAVGRLEPDEWTPPAILDSRDCFQPAIETYFDRAESTVRLLDAVPVNEPGATSELGFHYHSDVDAMSLAEMLISRLDRFRDCDLKNLVDLGGELKQVLLAEGYRPTVNFSHEADAWVPAESRALVTEVAGVA